MDNQHSKGAARRRETQASIDGSSDESASEGEGIQGKGSGTRRRRRAAKVGVSLCLCGLTMIAETRLDCLIELPFLLCGCVEVSVVCLLREVCHSEDGGCSRLQMPPAIPRRLCRQR